MKCKEAFNALTRRRHHCRACGYVSHADAHLMNSVQYVLYSRWMKEDIHENGFANLKQFKRDKKVDLSQGNGMLFHVRATQVFLEGVNEMSLFNHCRGL